MDRLTLPAPAKINLTLEVDPPRPDGYHPIRSLIAELSGLFDDVEIVRAKQRRVICSGVPERENLAWKALDVLDARVSAPCSVSVTITKRIPSQAGLGGGSSDAAATLVGANQLLALGLSDEELLEVAAQVGSDVAFFIRGGVQYATGRGEILASATIPKAAVVLARLPIGLPTLTVYRAFDGMTPPPRHAPLVAQTFDDLVRGVRNDLWPAALALAPGLGRLARAVAVAGVSRVLLCGSGSTIAGLVTTVSEAEAVATHIKRQLPEVWTGVSLLGAPRDTSVA